VTKDTFPFSSIYLALPYCTKVPKVGNGKPKEQPITKARKGENTKEKLLWLFFVPSSFRAFVIVSSPGVGLSSDVPLELGIGMIHLDPYPPS